MKRLGVFILYTLLFFAPFFSFCSDNLVAVDVSVCKNSSDAKTSKDLAILSGFRLASRSAVNILFNCVSRLGDEFFQSIYDNALFSFSISNESIIYNQYSADIRYRFYLEEIEKALSVFSCRSKSILLIPLYQLSDGSFFVWKNSWLEAWMKNASLNSDLNIFENISSLKLDQLQDPDFLNALADEYYVDDVIVIKCKNFEDNVFEVIIDKPSSLQSSTLIYTNVYGIANSEKFFAEIVNDISDVIMNSILPSLNVSIENNENKNFFLMIKNPGANWVYIRNKILSNSEYTISYISSNLVILELPEVLKYEISKKLRKHKFKVDNVQEGVLVYEFP